MKPHMPLLVMFVGVPGSGKTTFARLLAKKLDAVLLNSDAIRISMWKNLDAIQATHASSEERAYNNQLTFGAMDYATVQSVDAGYNVVYDCNANKLAERQEKHDIAAKYGALSIVVRIKVPHETALLRAQTREEAHDQRQMSAEKAEAVLLRFANEIEEPADSELVIEMSGEIPFEEQYELFMQKLQSFV